MCASEVVVLRAWDFGFRGLRLKGLGVRVKGMGYRAWGLGLT